MIELLISVVSLLILFLIIYFLPLKISKKGKGALVLVAFLFAQLGLLARDSFQLWQIVLILLLLSIISVYLVDKKLGDRLYASDSVKNNHSQPLFKQKLADFEDTDNEPIAIEELSARVDQNDVEELVPQNEQPTLDEPSSESHMEDATIAIEELEESQIEKTDVQTELVEPTRELEQEKAMSEIEEILSSEQFDHDDQISLDEPSLELQQEDVTSEIEDLLSTEQFVSDKNLEEILIDGNEQEEVNSTKTDTTLENSSVDEELLFLEERQKAIEEESLAAVEAAPTEEGYMADIEKLLESDFDELEINDKIDELPEETTDSIEPLNHDQLEEIKTTALSDQEENSNDQDLKTIKFDDDSIIDSATTFDKLLAKNRQKLKEN